MHLYISIVLAVQRILNKTNTEHCTEINTIQLCNIRHWRKNIKLQRVPPSMPSEALSFRSLGIDSSKHKTCHMCQIKNRDLENFMICHRERSFF